ncbi:hypothetical protein QCA50_002918 [Cerrena zonata]|uniref:Uncharacterized protein n=1 Tax=Cerrena zonata TaxID=2478898 RepID=A0AAW0GQP3_9APHY
MLVSLLPSCPYHNITCPARPAYSKAFSSSILSKHSLFSSPSQTFNFLLPLPIHRQRQQSQSKNSWRDRANPDWVPHFPTLTNHPTPLSPPPRQSLSLRPTWLADLPLARPPIPSDSPGTAAAPSYSLAFLGLPILNQTDPSSHLQRTSDRVRLQTWSSPSSGNQHLRRRSEDFSGHIASKTISNPVSSTLAAIGYICPSNPDVLRVFDTS